MTTSSFSRPSTAPPVHSSASRQSRMSSARRSAEPRDDVSRHNSITATSRPHRLGPAGSIPSSTASSRFRSSSTWQRRRSPSSSSTDALDMIMPILSAFIGMLKPSEALLRAFDELRRPIADAVNAIQAVSSDTSAQPTVRWWCPCCRHHHTAASCSALARVSPCKHCGEGHSNRSCSLRRAEVSTRVFTMPIKAQLAPSHLSANSSLTRLTLGALTVSQWEKECSREVAQGKRTRSVKVAARVATALRRRLLPQ